MANRDQLRRSGLRAYETGRLRMAARAAWILGPATLVCALETGAGEMCACIGALLLVLSIYLRWRDRRGVSSVRDGLLAGAPPLLAGLLVARLAPGCADAPLISLCTALCLGIGLPSGIWLGVRVSQGRALGSSWLAGAGIAALAASMGCAGLGVAGLTGAGLGLLLGAASARVLVHPAT